MNDVLRLLRRSLRPFGYDVRKRNTYNLLPFRSADPLPCLDRVRQHFDYDGGTDRKSSSNLCTLKIIYRTCLNQERNLKAHSKLSESPLVDTVERCFLSLVASVNAALEEEDAPHIEVLILDDRSEPAFLDRIQRVAGQLRCQWTVRMSAAQGQGASLHQQFDLARNDDALFYFCEDDYIHENRAVYEMWAFYRQIFQLTNRHLVLHPQEHESLYDNSHYPSYLVLSPFRHWRSVSDATHILFTHSHVVRDYWNYFENTKFVGDYKNRRLGSERRTTNLLYEHLPCFVPIPALAGHLQAVRALPPFFDWRRLWETNRPPSSA